MDDAAQSIRELTGKDIEEEKLKILKEMNEREKKRMEVEEFLV